MNCAGIYAKTIGTPSDGNRSLVSGALGVIGVNAVHILSRLHFKLACLYSMHMPEASWRIRTLSSTVGHEVHWHHSDLCIRHTHGLRHRWKQVKPLESLSGH